MEALKRELGMQSNKLDPVIKERVEAAIARLGYRVTVGQVGQQQEERVTQTTCRVKTDAQH